NLLLQNYYHLDTIPLPHFSLYHHILHTSLLFNIIPQPFQPTTIHHHLLFHIPPPNKHHLATTLIKYFNTNYHYI
ncbi:hypothetical protein, partial [Staphylococcus aureus]|uniref:hypothetical protein n=1 Tax=Staphylococcus aureus TaxID=1280 RepID=UPI0011A26697